MIKKNLSMTYYFLNIINDINNKIVLNDYKFAIFLVTMSHVTKTLQFIVRLTRFVFKLCKFTVLIIFCFILLNKLNKWNLTLNNHLCFERLQNFVAPTNVIILPATIFEKY